MSSTLSNRILTKYARDCRVFIETGTARGDGIQAALDFGGFERIYSIEANPDVWRKANDRFLSIPHVYCLHGDSGVVLKDLLRGTSERCCLWLDAHWSTGETDLGPAVSKCPLMADLHAVSQHGRKDHVILIDDMRYFYGQGLPQWGGITEDDILTVVEQINQAYYVAYEDSSMFARDVMVAYVPAGPHEAVEEYERTAI